MLAALLAVSPKFITYEQFGAVGDGVTDDSKAIFDAHEAANRSGRPVKADGSKTYLIRNPEKPARIQTDVDWGSACFIIDDAGASNPEAKIFVVAHAEKKVALKGLETLKKGSRNLGLKLPVRSFVEVVDQEHRVYIRKGSNANAGSYQKEYLVVEADGTISADTPVVWDYSHISSVTAYPLEERQLTIRGGNFITKANCVDSPQYYNRNITISRSNVRLVRLTHRIEGEGAVGAPYHGFITVTMCADVILDSLTLSAHKTYYKTGKLGKPSAKGSYDMSLSGAVRISVRNCSQFTDIDDPSKWGIMGSNFCKDIKYENCVLSRFDAHQGVVGANIRNCTISKVNAIGFGTFTMENCEIHNSNLIFLRGDYGSSWEGEFIIRNTTLKVPSGSKTVELFRGYNFRDHDFGYDCTMPEKISISGLRIDDSAVTDPSYSGPKVFTPFPRKEKNVIEGYHYPATREVVLRGVSVSSGKPVGMSDNDYGFFNGTKLTIHPELSWSIMHPTVLDTVYMRRVLDISKSHEMDSFEVCGACGAFTDGSLDGLLYFEDYPEGAKAVNKKAVRHNRESLKAIVRMCHEAGKPVYYWHREVLCNPGILKDVPVLLDSEGEFDLLGSAYEDFLRYKIARTFELVPDLDGIVLTLTEASASAIHNSRPEVYPPEKVVEKIGRVFAEELSKRGKKLILRSFGSIEQDYNTIEDGAELLAKSFPFEVETKITPYDFSPFKPDNKFLHRIPGCTISAECDGLGEYMGAGRMSAECLEDIVRYVRHAVKCGVDRYTIRLDRWGKNVFDSYPINLYAYERAIQNPEVTADEIRRDYYGSRYRNRKVVDQLCRMSEEGRQCVLKSLFINGSLIFHQFPTTATLHYLKAGGIFSLFSWSGSGLSAKSQQWGVADDRNTPGRDALLKEKEEAVAIASRNLSLLKSLKSKLSPEDSGRLSETWNYAYVEAVSNLELCKVVAAYFDAMEKGDDNADGIRKAVDNLKNTLSGMKLNRPVDGIADLVLSDFAIESAMRAAEGGCADVVIPAGIYDDIRGERYMHGASVEYSDGKMYLKIGNKIFPNAYYKTTLKGCSGNARLRITGKGMCRLSVNGEETITALDTAFDVKPAGSYTVCISKAPGCDYPSVASISISAR